MAGKVSFGIASTATITHRVFPGMKTAEGCSVAGVGSREKSKADEFCKKHELGQGMTYEELQKAEGVDAIYVPLPTGLRLDFMQKAILNHKHIYSEKPLAGTVKELKELLDVCEKEGLQWMDGTMWYHSNRTLDIEKKIKAGAVGKVMQVSAAFTFSGMAAGGEEWVNGGNGRTDKNREPMGCLGDQGWYPISAVLFAYDFELPEKVMATHTTLNKVDTIIACAGVMWFKGGRVGFFDCGCTMAHRSQFEIVGETGVIKVNDLVGGQGRSGNFAAYEQPFVGSDQYVVGDVMGKDEVVTAEPCDHAKRLVEDFAACVTAIKAGGKPNPEWPRRSLAVHTVHCAVFESATNGGKVVTL